MSTNYQTYCRCSEECAAVQARARADTKSIAVLDADVVTDLKRTRWTKQNS